MPTPAVKICGISTHDALEAAIRAQAAYAGFVFFARSPRNVAPAQAAELGARAQGRIRRVGLFVDAGDAAIAEAVTAAGLDVLQLHGRESPERAAELRSRFGLPVWKAIAIASTGDVARAHAYAGAADLMLFDAKTPVGNLPGGIGLSFDWSLVAHWDGPVKWGLAGGLTAGNVGHAIALTGAPLIDTSSGVESAPGVKDTDKIAAFCAAARAV
ncbi:MAG: phosphoribosylanthranilate isomerase [Novosphingobium sp.]